MKRTVASIEAWPRLSDEVKAAILKLVKG